MLFIPLKAKLHFLHFQHHYYSYRYHVILHYNMIITAQETFLIIIINVVLLIKKN